MEVSTTIPFNKPYLTGKETHYVYQAVASGKISGDGLFTKKCHQFFEERFGFPKCLLTTSCTDALEMAAILLDIQAGDEVILPSYTFVSTANAFVLRGAKLVFADSAADNPNMDIHRLRNLITSKTKVIVPVHYAGIACDMDALMDLANEFGIYVVEDAAQAVDSWYTSKNGSKKPLGSIGHMAAFSFHETKNIMSGEGGMLVINDPKFSARAEIIREKGTNRSAFFRGEIDKYGWVDMGSSFLPSDILAAFLFAQLENLNDIQNKRKEIWNFYNDGLQELARNGKVSLPFIPNWASNNAHMYYIVCKSAAHRHGVIDALKKQGIMAVFHYLSLHKSEYYKDKHDGRELVNSDHYSDCLVRLPMYYELTQAQQELILQTISTYFLSV
jgi:dTDP-4-amino-4,6-dideoxygalactose transaminase